MANFLVTGGAGFIGSNIVETLLIEGHTVRVLDNFSTGKRENLAPFMDHIELVEADMREPEACSRAVEDVDYVLHQAAMASVPRSVAEPVETSAINVMGAITLLKAAADAGVKRVVYAASSSAYGDQPVSEKVETLLPAPLSPYAAAKLSCEYFMRAFATCYPIETVCLRYFNVFGPRQDPNSQYSAVIPLFVKAILEGRQPTIFGDGQQTRDFTFVANNVRANIQAATAPGEFRGEVYNVACGTSYSLLDLVAVINDVLGTSVEPLFAPPRTGDVIHSLADISAAGKAFDYSVLVDFNEGMRRTIEWYKESLKA